MERSWWWGRGPQGAAAANGVAVVRDELAIVLPVLKALGFDDFVSTSETQRALS